MDQSPRNEGDSQPSTEERLGLQALILNTDFPVFPGSVGSEHFTTRELVKLARRVGLVSMVHSEDALRCAEQMAADGLQLYLWKAPQLGPGRVQARPVHTPWVVKLHNAVTRAFRFVLVPTWPRDTHATDLQFRNMSGVLTDALRERTWDAFIVVQSSSAAAIDRIPEQPVKVLVMHDIRSVVYERRAQTARNWRERRRYLREARRYFRFERAYAQRYDLLIALSEVDAAWIRKNYQPRQVVTLPLAVDTNYFAPRPDAVEQPWRILFTGLMSHAPNADAAVYFAREVFPLIREVEPQAEFFIVGRTPTPEVLRLRELAGVTVTGEVPDTRPYFESASVVVVPLRFGSGVRNKILEAWSMEKCVVSTTVGAEGLQYADGRELLIADTPEELRNRVMTALGDPALRTRLAAAGRLLATTMHEPTHVGAQYHQALDRAVQEKHRAREAGEPLRVLLDFRWMVPGRAGGIENLARAFMSNLIDFDRHNRYTVVVPSRTKFDFDVRRSANVRLRHLDDFPALRRDLMANALAFLTSKSRIDFWISPEVRELLAARKFDAEIAYSVTGFIHPELYTLRNVLLVPDIQHEYHPEFFSLESLMERRRVYRDSIAHADHLCAISDFTRRTLIEKLGVPPDKITTTHLAADPIFRAEGPPGYDRAVLEKFRLEERGYLFFPGHTWKHKNHRLVIEALDFLRRRGRNVLLVCTGEMREAQGELLQQISQLGLESQVRFLGYCQREQLPALYRNAAMLVFPSMFEGFGMPVVEAMACGTPVVCSNQTSLPEVAGDAALLVGPTDVEELAEAIVRVLDDAELRAKMRELGLRQAQSFSWERFTLDTIAVFQKVSSAASCRRAVNV